MIILFKYLFRNKLISNIVCLAILILFCFSCKEEIISELDFEFQPIEIVYYPEKHISINFNIEPIGGNEPYNLNWFEPDYQNEEGPYSITIDDDILLDFEIVDAVNTSKRFTYEIKTDSIDSLIYDYRNRFVGSYACNVTSSYSGSVDYFLDTLVVEKNNSYKGINILIENKIANNYTVMEMSDPNIKEYNCYSAVSFYGYHSGVSFSNDSIFYTLSGPLGHYNTNVYKGAIISE